MKTTLKNILLKKRRKWTWKDKDSQMKKRWWAKESIGETEKMLFIKYYMKY